MERELPLLARHMGLTTIRVWLMYGVYAADPAGLHGKMDRFLGIAAKSNSERTLLLHRLCHLARLDPPFILSRSFFRSPQSPPGFPYSSLAHTFRPVPVSRALGVSVGFVFFGDCFNKVGGSVAEQCTPHKGIHNGCWMTSPQASERAGVNASNGYAAFAPYVRTTVARFKDDPRVRET